jgi:hypothetical protein
MMKSKTTVALSTAAIAAVALLFAAGPLVGTQQALAYTEYTAYQDQRMTEIEKRRLRVLSCMPNTNNNMSQVNSGSNSLLT